MKTAMYFSESNAQLVLTPETKWEQTMLKMVKDHFGDKAYWGKFEYQTSRDGKYITFYSSFYNDDPRDWESLIVRMSKIPDAPPPTD